MAANKRTVFERERDLALVAESYLQGKRQWEIAEQLQISQSQVSYDMEVIRRRWRESAVTDYGEVLASELERINQIEREAWRAWHRSKESRKTATTSSARTSIKVEEQTGNAAYLLVILKGIDMRCELLGLYNSVAISANSKAVMPRPVEAEAIELHSTEMARRVVSLLEMAKRL